MQGFGSDDTATTLAKWIKNDDVENWKRWFKGVDKNTERYKMLRHHVMIECTNYSSAEDLYQLAMSYYKLTQNEKSLVSAINWLAKSASLGYSVAESKLPRMQYELGMLYYSNKALPCK